MNEATKPVIFLAFANDLQQGGTYLRNLAQEAAQLRAQLEQAETLCTIVERHGATPEQILEVFQRYKARIVIFHYAGHAEDYELLLESAIGARAIADGRGLAAFLRQQKGLQLLFLNACSTRIQVEGLLDAGVAAVIATSRAIDDQTAASFARHFYSALANGDRIRTSFEKAQAALQFVLGDLTRHLRPLPNPLAEHAAAGWPWALYLRRGAEASAAWDLPSAANDPLFGLPPLPEMDLPAKPFRDLSWFRRADAPIFFGRGHQIRQLYTVVTDPKTVPPVLFYGQSGVGKSSLLDAGLLPRLEQVHNVAYLRRDQAQGLLGTLLANFPANAGPNGNILEEWRAAEQQADKPLTLIIDQVEEHFTRPNQAIAHEMAEFLDALVAIFANRIQRPQGKLILGFRKEWLAEIEKRLRECELPFSKVFLERLDEAGVIEAVSCVALTPALQQHYGLTVEADLADEIAHDLLKDREAPVGPMLQILLTRLWEEAIQRARAHPRFDRALYDKLRRDGLKLQEFLDRQLAQLRVQQPELVDSGLALDLLNFHTTPLGTAEQRDFATLQKEYQHRNGILKELVRSFQNLYLLVDPAADQTDATQKSRLAHDTLAPLIRARFDESDLPGQRAQRILETRAVDWDNETEGTPLDEVDLRAVEAGLTGMRIPTQDEKRVIEASRIERERQEAERTASLRKQEEDRQRQLVLAQQMAQSESARAQAQTLATTRLRLMLMASIGLVVAMLIAIGILVLPTLQEWRALRLARGEVVTIPAGTAVIGTDLTEAEREEKPQWSVAMHTFKIEKYEVSNYQYRLCAQHGGCSDTVNPLDIYKDERADYPVQHLTALQAAAYCSWIGRRLPTEIEWEYAARGTTGRLWPWGKEAPSNERGCTETTQTCSVTSYPYGSTPEGIHHLWGNVLEWTSSYYQDDYQGYDVLFNWNGEPTTLLNDPVLVLRGGSYKQKLTTSISYRLNATIYPPANDYGVRCVED